MPIATHKPVEVVTQDNLPKVQPDHVKTIVYDDKNVPIHSLIAYISGASWTADYYSQVVGEHNDLREVDPGQNAVYQQYQKINGFEFRVVNPLTTNYNSETGITTVTGSGMTYPFIVPNINDYFVTDTADNQKAILKITQVERRTFNRDSVFNVEYQFVGYVSTHAETFYNLEEKTIRQYHFSKDRLLEGLQPIVKTEEYEKITSLKSLYRQIVDYYFDTFFDRKYFTLTIPGQEYAVYDSFLMNYIMTIVETTDSNNIRLIKHIPTDNDRYLSQPQFWTLMTRKDYDGKKYCNDVMKLVDKRMFTFNTYVEGIKYSNIDYILYPYNPDTSTLVQSTFDIKPDSSNELQQSTKFKEVPVDPSDNVYIKDTTTYSLIHDVLVDDKYILSANFYNNTTNQSVLEILVKDYLKGQSLDLDMLGALCSKFRTWKRLEQFYYGPILMTLVKEADRGQYT